MSADLITTLVGDFPQLYIGIAIGLLIACALRLIRRFPRED